MAKCILLLAIIVPSILGQCNVHKAAGPFKRAIYDFSLELTTRVAVENDQHFVTSPFSVWTILSAVSRGAQGTTLAELKKVLTHHSRKCFNHNYYSIARRIFENNTDVTVERSGVIVIDKALDVKPYFIRKIKNIGFCKLLTLSHDDLEQGATEINMLVANATHGVIDEICDSEDLVDKPFLLIDTVYFKGGWTIPFLPSETEVAPFYNEENESIGDVNLMFVNDVFNRLSMDQIGATVLELPYGKEKRFSMLIFLPYEGTKLMTVIENMKSIMLRSIFSLFKDPADQVMVQLPRFKIETDLNNLEELLKDMGLETMFDVEADFSSITDVQLHVNGVKQKASIVVNEEGTVASAATDLEFQDRSLPPQVTIQRPFLFMIVEKPREVVLFTGAYSKPSLF